MNPKKKSKELKRISRENLNGRYRLSMSVFLTVTLINLFSDLPFTYLLGNVYATKVQTVIYYIAEVLSWSACCRWDSYVSTLIWQERKSAVSAMYSTALRITPTDILEHTSYIMPSL